MHCRNFILSAGALCATIFYAPMAQRPRPAPYEVATPTIAAYWSNAPTERLYLRDMALRPEPLFGTCNLAYVSRNLLPMGPISHRTDPAQATWGRQIAPLLEELIAEIRAGKSEFTHFEPLKTQEFNTSTQTGFMVVAFKEHPFVAKIFIEDPEHLIRPYERGLTPLCMYLFSGGGSRYFAGFTRVRNREILSEHFAQNPVWASVVSMPRKWFWIPKNVRWFWLEGEGFAGHDTLRIMLPSVYVVIADKIDASKSFSLLNTPQAHTSLELCRQCHYCLDPNISNFVLEERTAPYAEPEQLKQQIAQANFEPRVARFLKRLVDTNQQICLYDTEHYQTIFAMHDTDIACPNHLAWYLFSGLKMLEAKLSGVYAQSKLDPYFFSSP